MKTKLSTEAEVWPIRGTFSLSRGSRTEARVVVCRIARDGFAGFGECVPYARYGESVESVLDQIGAVAPLIEEGGGRREVLKAMSAGAARNAVDCALWDLEAKLSGTPVHRLVCSAPPRPLSTCITISLDDPEEMAQHARANASRGLLKVKLGGEGDIDRIHAVSAAAPEARIILDANESWNENSIHDLMMVAAQARVVLIEQPLPADRDEILEHIPHPVPICADESVHVTADLEAMRERYDAVNIKLDKAGGLTEALAMRERAHAIGYSVMVGCMVGTSLSMAPAVLLAQEAQYVDLDGPLLLARDRPHGLAYSPALVSPPARELWG
ncbi:MAG: N-acetyl-D-Glu racemase DgcA [Pseudomonadota bacterium]|nr:N-acetyl-D-Glu racemase DgcA [Pseudomonadota bacterium]